MLCHLLSKDHTIISIYYTIYIGVGIINKVEVIKLYGKFI